MMGICIWAIRSMAWGSRDCGVMLWFVMRSAVTKARDGWMSSIGVLVVVGHFVSI